MTNIDFYATYYIRYKYSFLLYDTYLNKIKKLQNKELKNLHVY